MTDDSKGGELIIVRTMTNYNILQSHNIKYLPSNKFSAIYNMIKAGNPSWDIIGETINEKPITEEEFRFVINATQGVSVSNG